MTHGVRPTGLITQHKDDFAIVFQNPVNFLESNTDVEPNSHLVQCFFLFQSGEFDSTYKRLVDIYVDKVLKLTTAADLGEDMWILFLCYINCNTTSTPLLSCRLRI